jgi:tetratricopeptide (TPR) repeat protein
VSAGTVTDAARDALLRFARGRGEAALRLAMHAAVPQTFRPDLLHLLRINFVPEAAVDAVAAESDVLLAPFCTALGADFFRFETEVRRQLLDHLVASYALEAPSRLRRIAAMMLAYLDRAESMPSEKGALVREHLVVERWVAAGFLEPLETAKQFARALAREVDAWQGIARAELFALGPALALPLQNFPELLAYAETAAALETGDTQRARTLVNALPRGPLSVAGEKLPSLARLARGADLKHTPPSRPREQEAFALDSLEMTLFAPQAVRPGQSDIMEVFLHRRRESPDPAALKVQELARVMLGETWESYSVDRQKLSPAHLRASEVTVVSQLEGIEIDPPTLTLRVPPPAFRDTPVGESISQAQLRIHVPATEARTRLLGSIRLVDHRGVVLAERPLRFLVYGERSPSKAYAERASRKVFACSAVADAAIVRRFEGVVKALGHSLFTHDSLRAGMSWQPEIMRAIADADVFQLFWSHAASQSEWVRGEVEVALGLNRPDFIRPVYWETPIPPIPPELARLHFARISVDSDADLVQALSESVPAEQAASPFADDDLGDDGAEPEAELGDKDDPDEAKHRQMLAIEEMYHGPDHPTVAIRLNKLALLLHDTNRLNEAEDLYRRALDIAEENFGSNHPTVAIYLSSLAKLLQDTHRLDEAEALHRRAIAINEKSYGPDHPEVAIHLNNLAKLLQDTNRLVEAEDLYRRTLAIAEQTDGPDQTEVATRLSTLAKFLQATDRLSEAEALYRRALAIDESAVGADEQPLNENLFRSVDELELSLRSANYLQNANITLIGELVQKTEQDMLKSKNWGRKSLKEIKEILATLGLGLGMKFHNWPAMLERWKQEQQAKDEAARGV